jgi:hypothetical protein
VHGIEEWLTEQLGLRAMVVAEVWRRQSGTSGDVVLGLRARGASLSSGEASRGIGWSGGGLKWLVHDGRGSGGRWHTVHRARSGELALGRG